MILYAGLFLGSWVDSSKSHVPCRKWFVMGVFACSPVSPVLCFVIIRRCCISCRIIAACICLLFLQKSVDEQYPVLLLLTIRMVALPIRVSKYVLLLVRIVPLLWQVLLSPYIVVDCDVLINNIIHNTPQP